MAKAKADEGTSAVVAQAQQPANRVVAQQGQLLQALAHELDSRMAVMAASAMRSIDPAQQRAVVLGLFTRTPALWECTPVSIARAVTEAVQRGLDFRLQGHAYLVPYRNSKTGQTEAQLITGYPGLVDLVRRTGKLAKVEARVVRAKDTFAYGYGLAPYLEHVPYRPPAGAEGAALDPGPLTDVYAIAHFTDGTSPQFVVQSAAEVDAIRRRSKAKDGGPWVSDYFEMAKKTAVRNLTKLLPQSVEVAGVLRLEDEAEDGTAYLADMAASAAAQVGAGTARARAALQAHVGLPVPPANDMPDAAPDSADTAALASTGTDAAQPVEATTAADSGAQAAATVDGPAPDDLRAASMQAAAARQQAGGAA